MNFGHRERERIRRMGAARFVALYGVLLWGVPMGLVMWGVKASLHPVGTSPGAVAATLLVWIAGGAAFGVVVWWRLNRPAPDTRSRPRTKPESW